MAPGFPHSLFQRLAEVIDAQVSFDEERSGPEPGDDPFTDGSTDLGWICSTSYIDLATRSAEPSVQLTGVAWVPDDPDANGRPVYFGDIITRADSGIETFDDLAGCQIGCNDEVSLSGHHAIRWAIRDQGHSTSFAELVFTGGHHTSIDQVLSGQLDAAVVDSVVRTGRARLDPDVADLRIVERLGPWPVQPLVARSSLDAETVDEVRRLLLEASEHPEVQAELKAAALSHLVEVGPDHYEVVRKAFTRPS